MNDNNDSRFVRMAEYQTESTVVAPCGTLVEIYSGEGRDGSYATPSHYFVCGGCGEHHTIISVTPPLVS